MWPIGKAILGISLLWAQGLKYTTDIEAALKEAKKTKKPLWVMVSATWCAPCRWTEKEVLTQPWFDSLIRPNFIALKVYAASGSGNTPGGEELARKYRVKAYPTFLFLYPNGEVFYLNEGAPLGENGNDPEVRENWQKIIQQALTYRTELPSLRQKFEKGDRSPEVVRPYFNWALKAADSATFHKAWEAYLKAFPSPRSAWLYEPQAYRYLEEAALRLPAARTYALEIADTLQILLPYKTWKKLYEEPVRGQLLQHLQEELPRAKSEGSPNVLFRSWESTIAYARELQKRFPFAESMALEMAINSLYKASGNAHDSVAFMYALQYMALVKSIEPPDSDERSELASSLNSIAWDIYEHSENPAALWSAVTWTKEALSYEPEAWYIWDTLGALYYKLKRKKEAIQALSKAIDLAKTQKVPEREYRETQELLQKARTLE